MMKSALKIYFYCYKTGNFLFSNERRRLCVIKESVSIDGIGFSIICKDPLDTRLTN